MNAAHDDGYAEAAKVSGHLIAAIRLRGEGGDAYPGQAAHGLIVRHAQVFVNDRDFPLRRGQARENHEAEWFPYAVTVPAALLDSHILTRGLEGLIRHSARQTFAVDRFVPSIRQAVYLFERHIPGTEKRTFTVDSDLALFTKCVGSAEMERGRSPLVSIRPAGGDFQASGSTDPMCSF